MNYYEAPARLCLAGEDLDWLGYKCCCLAIDLPTRAVLTGEKNCHQSIFLERTWQVIKKSFNIPQLNPPNVKVCSRVPVASGMASSTGLTTALVQLCLDHINYKPSGPLEIAELVYEIENSISNCGGMDQLAIALGGVTYTQGAARTLPSVLGTMDWVKEYQIVVINSGIQKSTVDHISKVNSQVRHNDAGLSEYIKIADQCAQKIWKALGERNYEKLVFAVNTAHETMRDNQNMSTSRLEALRTIALENGCSCVKLTGAGGGGSLFAIVGDGEAFNIASRIQKIYMSYSADITVEIIKPFTRECSYA